MATYVPDLNAGPKSPNAGGGHQRAKSAAMMPFAHRRMQSDGSHFSIDPAMAPAPLNLKQVQQTQQQQQQQQPLQTGETPIAMAFSKSPAGALGELQQNQQDAGGPRSPRKTRDIFQSKDNPTDDRGRSPTKSAFSTFSKMAMDRGKSKSRDVSPDKPKKNKSSTNLVGLLTRPKSSRGLNKMAKEDELREAKDKENRTPPASTTTTPDLGGPPPPIFAQFSSQDLGQRLSDTPSYDSGSAHGTRTSNDSAAQPAAPARKERPKSFHPQMLARKNSQSKVDGIFASTRKNMDRILKEPASSERIATKAQRPKIFTAFSAMGTRADKQECSSPNPDASIDPKDVDGLLEAMLDRRNIPENQRFKMRNLNTQIKMEFIRQDWAEMAARNDGPPTATGSTSSLDGGPTSAAVAPGVDEDSHPKRTRGRSFTIGRTKKDGSKSPTKKSRIEGTLGRHFRTKSTESINDERPTSSGSATATSTGILSKIKLGQGASDYVAYLRKVQQPESVEVGKLHKLRLLLRNETVSWTEDFIKLGGMEEIVGLLNRILEVEWREEHEDALLHETLLCLKALCTTALAIQYVDTIHKDLFPRLIHMIFDPEKKGPSEYTTRNIVTTILSTYIESATPQERIIRSKLVLSYLRNPKPKDDHVPFVKEMHKERPYTVWNKEAVCVTKEVFWIFLHNLNVIALPSDVSSKGGSLLDPKATAAAAAAKQQESMVSSEQRHSAYMHKHFPQPRPPVAAAPYVGGVEWDATNYLASHLDLVNAIIACTPTQEQRNTLRENMRISGWERCMGGTLRLCKEKFYGCVHEALRTWVAAAVDDGWDVKDVRYGPPPDERRKSPKKPDKNADADKENRGKPGGEGPKIEIPKLEFGLPSPGVGGGLVQSQQKEKDEWLS